MNINITFFGQVLTFLVFVFFTMYVVLPILKDSLEKRRKFIADGLQAAEEGRCLLKESSLSCIEKVENTKKKCFEMLENAKKEASSIVTAAVESASLERDLILQSGRKKLDKEVMAIKIDLQKKIGDLVLLGTEKLLQRCLTEKDHIALLNLCRKDDFKIF